MILHRIHKTTATIPWKSLSNQLQRCCCPRGKYTFVFFRRCVEVVKDLHDSQFNNLRKCRNFQNRYKKVQNTNTNSHFPLNNSQLYIPIWVNQHGPFQSTKARQSKPRKINYVQFGIELQYSLPIIYLRNILTNSCIKY